MNVSSHDLAAQLSERLNGVVPAGMSVRPAGAIIEICSSGHAVGRSAALDIIGDNDERSVTARIETATRAALSGVQDVIIEDAHSPWPDQPGHGMDLPVPDCRIVGDELFVWFGDETAPALALPPIRLR